MFMFKFCLKSFSLLAAGALLLAPNIGCSDSTVESEAELSDEDEKAFEAVDRDSLCLESPLVITEIQTHNLDWTDEFDETPSWIELYNKSDFKVPLDSFYLVDNSEPAKKWRIGEGVIKAHSYKTIFLDKRDIGLHAGWKLKEKGGKVFLTNSYFNVCDSASYPQMAPGVSYGKNSDGDWGYFSTPTPEKSNRDSAWHESMSEGVFLEKESGFYKEPITLYPPEKTDGTVRCTMDGSVPNEKSPAFIDSTVIESNTIVRCAIFKQGVLTRNITTRSYFIDEKVKMPVFSISIDPKFLEKTYYFDESKSPSAAYMNDDEVPVHVEYFEDGSDSKKVSFEIDAGLSYSGSTSRHAAKKSVKIKMREKYQDGKLNYPLFDVHPEKSSFKSFVLRNFGSRFNKDFIGDAPFTYLLEGTGIDYQRYQPAVVFYNGKYYGIHNIRENLDEHYIENNHGISAEDVQVNKILDANVKGDNPENYKALLTKVAKSDLTKDEDYASVCETMDIENFANYMAFEIYVRNDDWPRNNVRLWKTPNTPWKFIAYDIDFGYNWDLKSFQSAGLNMFNWIRKYDKSGYFATLYTNLIKNRDFRRLFINHSAILFNDFLTAEKAAESVDRLLDKIDEDEMDRDLKRFPRNATKSGNGVKKWAVERDDTVRDDYREEFDLGEDITVSFISEGSGRITVDGMELPGKSSHTNYKGTFFEGNDMLLRAVPDSKKTFVGWDDGNTENPRLVTPTDGDVFTARFK